MVTLKPLCRMYGRVRGFLNLAPSIRRWAIAKLNSASVVKTKLGSYDLKRKWIILMGSIR